MGSTLRVHVDSRHAKFGAADTETRTSGDRKVRLYATGRSMKDTQSETQATYLDDKIHVVRLKLKYNREINGRYGQWDCHYI